MSYFFPESSPSMPSQKQYFNIFKYQKPSSHSYKHENIPFLLQQSDNLQGRQKWPKQICHIFLKKEETEVILNFISNFSNPFLLHRRLLSSRHYGKSRGHPRHQWTGKSRQPTLASLFMVRPATAEKRCWNRLNHFCTDRDACRMKKKMESRFLKQTVTFNNSIFVVWVFFLYQESCYFIVEI